MSITSVVGLVAGKIGELLVEEAKFLYGVEGQVRSLQEELEMIQSFLTDMEAMGEEEGGDKRSHTTIKQIRKIAYDAEDVIESYILEASSSVDKKEDFLRRYLCFCTSLSSTHQVGSKIEAIKERLDKTMERWRKYMGEMGIRVDARQGLNKTTTRMRLAAYSHTHEDHVVGLDEDIQKLVRVLTDKEHAQIKIVTLVGMGGSGKTTLARKLYNNESVKKQFDCVAWISVSQQWDAQQITLDLLKKVTGETMTTNNSSFSHSMLVGKLHEYLEMKSYLIALDDVWESKSLQDIRPALPLEGDGRKIIITTRNEEVVNYSDLKPITYSHKPRRLTKEESWELFKKIALIHRDEINNSMEELGKEMLKKCGGLPLAVIALAGILFDKETFEEWEKVSKAVSSRIMEEGKGTQLYGSVNQMLVLSYLDLPPQLKPCFLYFARYPEDCNIQVAELIRIWIAEGFITTAQPCEGDTLVDVARQYLDELVHRCLVIVLKRNYNGKVKLIQIHDLVRDLCVRKATDEDFMETSTYPNSKNIESRRLVLPSQRGNPFSLPTNTPYLRSLVCEGNYSTGSNRYINVSPLSINYKLLRVLILRNVEICDGKLPVEVGSLIHLRYLELEETKFRELPSSIGNLRNLLTLHIRGNYYVQGKLRIPDVIWKLERLMYLHLYSFKDIKTLKLHTLKSLQTLKVVAGGNWMLKELPRLSLTVTKLTILEIRSQEQLDATFQCQSIRSGNIHSLRLVWDEPTMRNLEPIIHCQHLKKLSLSGRIRDGVGIQFPTNIIKLTLLWSKFEEEAALVALGKLPHLKILYLKKVYMGNQWTCNTGAFPQLKEFHVSWFSNLEEWSIERGAMPLLKTLRLRECNRLKKLPSGLELITTLQILDVSDMSDEFIKRINEGGEDFHIIQRTRSSL